jgi:hypothetical protein
MIKRLLEAIEKISLNILMEGTGEGDFWTGVRVLAGSLKELEVVDELDLLLNSMEIHRRKLVRFTQQMDERKKRHAKTGTRDHGL